MSVPFVVVLVLALAVNGTARQARWEVVKTPNPGLAQGRYLVDVSAASARSVWAVGATSKGPLAVHWNGTRWTVNGLPRPDNNVGRLVSVSALTAKDAWAFGHQGDPARCGVTNCRLWALHHTAAGWRTVHIAEPPTGFSFGRIRALSDHSFWATGRNNSQEPAAAHWDGHTWTQYVVPAPPGQLSLGFLDDIARVPGRQTWFASGQTDDGRNPLFARWSAAHGFERMHSVPPRFGGVPVSIVVFSKRNAWAVGTAAGPLTYTHPLLDHWDGSTWRPVAGPKLPGKQTSKVLYSLASAARNRLVAVGILHRRDGTERTLAERYNGKKWQVTDTVNPSTGFHIQDQLFAVTSVPGSRHSYWAVGDRGVAMPGNTADHTLAQRCVC